MPLVFIRHLGNNIAFVHSLDAVDPGYGRPGGGAGTDPGYDLPAWARPGHDLPGHGHPGGKPPGTGGIPDNELPSTPPPQVAAGQTVILIRKEGKWHYAAIDDGSVPDNTLPETPQPK